MITAGRTAIALGVLSLIACSEHVVQLDDGGEDAGEVDDGFREVPYPDVHDVSRDGQELPPACGDGNRDPGEECDDGNRSNGDECDWECRVGPGHFDYPPPDPTVPPAEPAGPPVDVIPAEVGLEAHRGILKMVYSNGVYGIAYLANYPVISVHFLTVHPDGTAAGAPWTRIEPSELPRIALVPVPAGFALLSWRGDARTSLKVQILDAAARPVGPTTDLRPVPEGATYAHLWAAGCNDRHCLAGSRLTPGTNFLLDLFDAADFRPRASTEVRCSAFVDLTVIVTTPDGYLLAGPEALIALDSELTVRSWTGLVLRPFMGCIDCPTTLAVGSETLLLAHARASESSARVEVAVLDHEGTLRMPPRTVSEVEAYVEAYGGLMQNPVRMAAGPAGIGMTLFYQHRREETDVGWVWAQLVFANLDRYGNLRSEWLRVGDEARVDLLPSVAPVALAADPTGFAVLSPAQDDRIVRYQFTRFEVPPP